MKNEIITKDWLTKPNEIIKDMSAEECLMTLGVINALKKAVEDLLREKVFNSTIDRADYVLPNGIKQEAVVSRGGTTIKTTKTKTIDYKKAIDFALDNKLHLPMVPEQIIPEHVDETQLENEQWFQENIEQFITTKEETKESKSSNRILFKDAK